METNARTNQSSGNVYTKSADTPVDKVVAGAHDVVDKLARAADEGIRKVKPAIDRVADLAHQALNNAGGVAGSAADWAGAKREGLKATHGKVRDEACSFVCAYPLKSIGIALLAGILIGRIVAS